MTSWCSPFWPPRDNHEHSCSIQVFVTKLQLGRDAVINGRKHEVPIRSSFGARHGCQLQCSKRRGRMRPRLASRSLWRVPAQSPSRRGSACTNRRASGPGRRGAARPRVPLWHGVALWTLPRHLSFRDEESRDDKAPLTRGFFHEDHGPAFRRVAKGWDNECCPSFSNGRRHLTSSNGGASSDGANDGDGGANPNNGGGASPSAGDASPNDGGATPNDGRDPNRDDGRGPSALLPA
jgi:hypothetical protein